MVTAFLVINGRLFGFLILHHCVREEPWGLVSSTTRVGRYRVNSLFDLVPYLPTIVGWLHVHIDVDYLYIKGLSSKESALKHPLYVRSETNGTFNLPALLLPSHIVFDAIYANPPKVHRKASKHFYLRLIERASEAYFVICPDTLIILSDGDIESVAIVNRWLSATSRTG